MIRSATTPQPLPGDEGRPTFAEPWEAQVFALVVALQEHEVLTRTEWAHMLGAKIVAAQARGDPDLGNTYYQHWLAALEEVAASRCGSSPEELGRYERAWARAAARCPHGRPIELLPCDFEPG